jgi:hypothetical protein
MDMQQPLPRPLNILVHKHHGGGRLNGLWTAMCLQFPVEARAATLQAAVTQALQYLLRYLQTCDEMKADPFSLADDMYQKLFYHGKELKIGMQDVIQSLSVRCGNDELLDEQDIRVRETEADVVGAES